MTVRKYSKTTSDVIFLDEIRDRINPADTLTTFKHGQLDAVSIDFTDVSGNAEADIDQAMAEFGFEPLADEANTFDGRHDFGRFASTDAPTSAIASEGDVGYDLTKGEDVFFNAAGLWVSLHADVDQFTFEDGSQQNTAATLDDAGWHLSTANEFQSFDVSTQDTNPRSIFFRPEGTAFFIAGNQNDTIFEYTMTTPWDVSTASIGDSFVLTGIGSPDEAIFNSTGTKMFVVNSGNDVLSDFDLSTAWDITTAVANTTFDFTPQDSDPQGLFFTPDGLTLFLMGRGSARIIKYDLTVAYDISTMSFSSTVLSVSGETTVGNSVFFKTDGRIMYIADNSGDIFEYALSTPYDITTAVVVTTLDISGDGFTGIFVKPDGTKFYISNSSLDVVQEFDLGLFTDSLVARDVIAGVSKPGAIEFVGGTMQATAATADGIGWHTETFTFLQDFDVSTQDTVPIGLYVREDGLKAYITGNTNDSIFEYTLSTAGDITTATHVGTKLISTETTGPVGIYFKSDGSKAFIYGSDSDIIFEYALSTNWDITSATFTQSSATIGAGQDIHFSPDGLEVFVTVFTALEFRQFSLNVAWDITTLNTTATNTFSISTEMTQPTGIYIKPDGTTIYATDVVADTIFEYKLVSPWSLATVEFVNSIATETTNPRGISSSPDGRKFYITDNTADTISEYDVGIVTTMLVADAVRVGRAGFAVTTNTAALGLAEIYACTDTTAARTLTLSSSTIGLGSDANPLKLTVKDESGGAATNIITIVTEGAETIDGVASVTIAANFGGVNLYSNGSNLFSLGTT